MKDVSGVFEKYKWQLIKSLWFRRRLTALQELIRPLTKIFSLIALDDPNIAYIPNISSDSVDWAVQC